MGNSDPTCLGATKPMAHNEDPMQPEKKKTQHNSKPLGHHTTVIGKILIPIFWEQQVHPNITASVWPHTRSLPSPWERDQARHACWPWCPAGCWTQCTFLKNIFLFIYINWRMITILWWFLPYISMNRPLVYMCSVHPQPPSYLPPDLSLQVVTEHRFEFYPWHKVLRLPPASSLLTLMPPTPDFCSQRATSEAFFKALFVFLSPCRLV